MEVKPFKAFRFDETIVGDVGNCIAPPYDCLNAVQQDELHKKSKYNIVRIIKGKTTASDNAEDNQYTRAADYLRAWIAKGALKQDSGEAIYAYVQDFQLAGAQFQRLSFIGLAKLEEFGRNVRPHEQTLIGPKIDRLNLRRAAAAEFGLVFMLYEDEQKIADRIVENAARGKPLVDWLDEQNVRHRLFAITAADDIEQITKMMLEKSCIIADGHHRYEAALNYYKETADLAAGYQMTAFVNTRHEGLLILATHRLVGNLEDFCLEKLLAEMEKYFEVTTFEFDSDQTKTEAKQKMLTQMKAEHDRDKNAFGIHTANNAFYVAVLKNKQAMDLVAADMSCAWRSLDVSVLGKLIFEKLLGIDEKKLASGAHLEYVKDTGTAVDESIKRVDAGQKQTAFFMNPVKMQQLKLVTEAGEKMPQKSTYFYPKVYTGLTINKL